MPQRGCRMLGLLVLLEFSLLLGSVLVASVIDLSSPWQERQVPVWVQGTPPIASGGYLVAHTSEMIGSAGTGHVALTSLQTGELRVLPFWLSGARHLYVESVSVNTRGHVLVAGFYSRTEPEQSKTNFVAEMNAQGKLLATYDLGDYTPERICSASDGTFWTFGQVWAKENTPDGEYHLLRHYSAEGGLKASYFPRSTLPREITLNYHARLPRANWAFLRCGEQSVAAFVGKTTPGFIWVEVDAAAGTTEHWNVRMPKFATINGLALLAKNEAYASFRPANASEQQNGGLFRLNRPGPDRVATWLPVGDNAPPFSVLLGREGSSLVHSKNLLRSSVVATIRWTKGNERR